MTDSHTVIIADKLVEPRHLALTVNQDTAYMSGDFDLRDGPMVMELPPGLLGTMNNIWRPLVGSIHGAVPGEEGSFDLYFGPTLPAGTPEANWAQTTPGK